jgi:hypothetical protein
MTQPKTVHAVGFSPQSLTGILSADFSRRKILNDDGSVGACPDAVKRPSPIKGDATEFVINHRLKPVTWIVLENSHADGQP